MDTIYAVCEDVYPDHYGYLAFYYTKESAEKFVKDLGTDWDGRPMGWIKEIKVWE